MNPLIIGPLIDMGKSLIEKFFPDKQKQAAERAAAELAMDQMATEAAQRISDSLLKSDELQVDVNKIEASSEDRFKSGWRPAIGWVGAMSLFVYYVPYCITATILWAYQVIHTGQLVARPDLGIADLFGLLSGLLGLSYMRTQEKKAGVA
jgi:hypothetical protein